MKNNYIIREIAALLKITEGALDPGAGLGVTANWDSMAQVEIMMLLEQRFGVRVDEHSIEKYATLANIINLAEGNLFINGEDD